jgi:spermidine synthase
LLPVRPRPFVLLYLLSGAAALLYEVAWLRLLTLSMGHTTAAVGAVLAAFMGGLAIGAAVGGRATSALAPRRALRMYAALEVTIALCALVMPAGLAAMRPLLAWAYANGSGGMLFDAVRLTVSIVLIAIPAAAMGASFPIGVVAVRDSELGIRDSKNSGSRDAGALYAMNTIGAALGAALTGFVLLPALGLFGTTLVGVALNAVAAVGALLLVRRGLIADRSAERSPAIADRNGPRRPTDQPHSLFNHTIALPAVVLGVSGFVALVYEVTWTRILAMMLGPTTYAFSAMLVAFIAGLGIGSGVAAALVSRVSRPGVWLGAAMIATAAAALVAGGRIDRLPIIIAASAGRADASFTSVFALDIALAIVVQLPMTIALGATFPLAIAMTSAAGEAAAAAAVIYATNTAGAIAGALAGSFILIPQLGLQRSLQLASIASVLAGLFVAWRSAAGLPGAKGGLRYRLAASIAATSVVAFALLMPPWNHARLANGAYRFAPSLAAGDIETALDAGDLSYYREGAAGTVSVRRLIGVTSLAIDGKVDASNGSDMVTQKLLAHLPLLLHDDPHAVYIIGLGSGVTLGAALRHPVERVVVSEISPEVVAASSMFAKENHDALHDPRARLIVGDGRSHLLLSGDRYDVIISEPSNPWMSGVSTLFTREFFVAARSRLEPGGILCQWAHTYNISDADLRSIVATFLSAFPDGSAWLVGESDLLLIGSTAPVRALDEGLTRAWARPGLVADLAEVGVRDPFSVLTMFVARGGDLQQYASNAPVQRDDRLALEYSAPRTIYGRYQNTNVGRLRALAARAQPPPALVAVRAGADAVKWRDRAGMEMKADSPQLAYEDFLQALSMAPYDAEALAGYVGAAASAGRLDAAEAYLRGRAAKADAAPLHLELSRVLSARGDVKGAVTAAQHAAALDPSNERALDQLVSALADDGNDAALEQLVGILTQSLRDRPVTTYGQMRLADMRGDFAQAAAFGSRLTTGGGDVENAARNFNLLGIAYANVGDHAAARSAFEASLRIAPRAPAVLMNLGSTELRSGHPSAAAERFSEALFLYPTLKPALDGLAQALDQQGDGKRAAQIRAVAGSRVR